MEMKMYYHVFIELENSYECLYDIDKTNLDEIIKNIATPYKNNSPFYFKGYELIKGKIRRFIIKETECSAKKWAEQKNANNEIIGIMYFPKNIFEDEGVSSDITVRILEGIKNNISKNISKNHSLNEEINNRKVFIVHGRDDNSKTSVARFIEQLGLEAIILHEQPNAGKTIIEKIEEYTDVGFAIVLYTPCDFGGLQGSKEQKPRARQNVVFEHGYLIAKLGRDRVCALVKEEVEFPSDINGVVYNIFDDNDAWKFKVARELQNAGYQIDMNKIKI